MSTIKGDRLLTAALPILEELIRLRPSLADKADFNAVLNAVTEYADQKEAAKAAAKAATKSNQDAANADQYAAKAKHDALMANLGKRLRQLSTMVEKS